MWFSIPGASCQVGWNVDEEDAGGGDNGSGGATSLVCGGLSGDSVAMVEVEGLVRGGGARFWFWGWGSGLLGWWFHQAYNRKP